MYDLKSFSLKEMTECGIILRNIGAGAKSMDEVADRIVRYLFDKFTGQEAGLHDFALVRLFKTHYYDELSDELRGFAGQLMNNETIQKKMKCLTLLATAGDRAEWNSKKQSHGHKAIPLASEKFVSSFPMISNLANQFGLEIRDLIKPETKIILDISKKRYNVFYVRDALGSSMIPAQDDFVIPCGIKSALGYGGILPSGDLFVVISFAKVTIGPEIAKLFETLALNIKLALLPFENKVFA